MPGRGPAPKPNRRRRNKPVRGEWTPAEGEGWQHGEIPSPPDGLKSETVDAWQTWFGAWFAAHWTRDDLPGLRLVALLYDQVQRGEYIRATELRQMMDNYGITPKGQQDRRWTRPKAPETPQEAPQGNDDPYGHLRVVNG